MAEQEVGGSKKKVMVAIDESEFSEYALEWVINNLRDSITTSSPLLIFTAQPLIDLMGYVPATPYGVAAVPYSPDVIRNFHEHQKKVKTSLLNKAKDICATHGIIAETISEVGDAREAICDAAEKFKVSLLVVGNHGKGALKRAFLGSVSSYCVHHAKCPVLVVKKPTH